MKKLILASVSAIALFGVAACSDNNTDSTTTESVKPPVTEQPAPATPQATPPATNNSTTQSITPAPETGTGSDMQNHDTMQPKPTEPAAPAQ